MAVLGTRPELVKLATVVKLLGDDVEVVHTGQHFTASLSDDISHDLGFPPPTHQLQIGGLSRGEQIGEATAHIARLLEQGRPDAVVVQGDTNSALAGALAANASEVPLVHVEAGLRSRDRQMPEEHNRVLVDHLADLCCAPTSGNVANLRGEGIPPERVLLTGNTIVEAVQMLLPPEHERLAVARRFLGSSDGPVVVATFHRPENVDDPARLTTIVEAVAAIEATVLFPIHPRTARTLGETKLPENLVITDPMTYRNFLSVLSTADAVLTDSGGIQEEVSLLKLFAVVLRRSTERPETLGSFTELMFDPLRAAETINAAVTGGGARNLQHLPCPFGDGEASARIVAAIRALP